MNRVKQLIKNKKIMYSIVVILLLVGVYTIARRDSIKTLPVKEVPLESIIVEKSLSTTGEVTSTDQADLAFKSMGKLAYIYVSEGDKVLKGDLLAQMDNSAEMNSLQSARDSRDIALRDREYFIAKYLYNKSGAGGTEEYEISLRKYDEIISQTEALLAIKQGALRDTYLYSPIDGTVYDVTKSVGESVAIGEPIVKVANLDSLVFEVQLDQEDYGFIAQDQSVKIQLDAYPNVELKGKVGTLPLFANGGSTSRFKVKMPFDENSEVTPLMGMTGDVHIIIASTNKEVPALFYDQVFLDESDNYYVWTVINGIITKTPIEVGLEGDIYYEVKTTFTNPIIVGQNQDITIKDGYKAAMVPLQSK